MPAGLLLGRSRRKGSVAINVANIGRAIPSFAILVLGVIWLGLGNRPALIALVLLAVPPIFMLTFTAVRQVDPATVEAARGMGMTEPRVLRTVQLPIALPLILNGIRLSSAAVIATATLAALVGGGGLGRYVVDGFAVRDFVEVFAGVVLVALLVITSRSSSRCCSASPCRRASAGEARSAAGTASLARSVRPDAAWPADQGGRRMIGHAPDRDS